MTHPNFIILHVDNPIASADFYQRLFKKNAVETHPTWAHFTFDSGLTLGLWSKHTVEPKSAGHPGCTEICFSVENEEQVKKMHQEWIQLGVPVIQPPVQMDFGFCFTAQDPDGHWLRVFAVSQS